MKTFRFKIDRFIYSFLSLSFVGLTLTSCISVSEFYQYEDGIYGRTYRKQNTPQQTTTYSTNSFTEELNKLGGLDPNITNSFPITQNQQQVNYEVQTSDNFRDQAYNVNINVVNDPWNDWYWGAPRNNFSWGWNNWKWTMEMDMEMDMDNGDGTIGVGTIDNGTIGDGTTGDGTIGAGTAGDGMEVPIIGTDLYSETDITAKETALTMAIIATEATPLQQSTTSLYTEDNTIQETIILIAKDQQQLKETTITKREDLLEPLTTVQVPTQTTIITVEVRVQTLIKTTTLIPIIQEEVLQDHRHLAEGVQVVIQKKINIMKRLIYITTIAIALLHNDFVFSQAATYIEHAIKLSQEDNNGTARYRAMSGAFGMGGDVSAIYDNPAGASVFSNNAITGSLNFDNIETQSNYYGSTLNTANNHIRLGQFGGVLSFDDYLKTQIGQILRLAFNYHINADFNHRYSVIGNNNEGLFNFNVNPLDDGTNLTFYDIPIEQEFINKINGYSTVVGFTFAGTYKEKNFTWEFL